MQWHPTTVKWCSYLHSKSPKAFENVHESGFISQTSQHTVHDNSHFLRSETYFQPDVIELFITHTSPDANCPQRGICEAVIFMRQGRSRDLSQSDETHTVLEITFKSVIQGIRFRQEPGDSSVFTSVFN